MTANNGKTAVLCDALEAEFLVALSQMAPADRQSVRSLMQGLSGPPTHAEMEGAINRLYEAGSSLEVLAEALGTLTNAEFAGGYGACYAIKRLIDQALTTLERVR